MSANEIGTVVANSGMSGCKTAVVLCEVGSYELKAGYEGITEVVELSPDELDEWIASGRITDGFTLSAWALVI